ncbi:hypothetical protein M2273_006310 [Mucilaginibacter lappiensis]
MAKTIFITGASRGLKLGGFSFFRSFKNTKKRPKSQNSTASFVASFALKKDSPSPVSQIEITVCYQLKPGIGANTEIEIL